MKAKLLKRLRKRYWRKYCICKQGRGWVVFERNVPSNRFLFDSIDKAKRLVVYFVRRDVLSHVSDYRGVIRFFNRTIKYYPW